MNPERVNARVDKARRRLARAESARERRNVRLTEALEALQLALDPELEAWAREHRQREAEERAMRTAKRQEHWSGWRRGQPQCPGCRRILTSKNGWCPDCRMYGDAGHDHGR